MSFALYGSPFTDGLTVVPAGYLNFVRTSLANAIDGAAGGTVAPSSIVQINGSGVGIGGSGLTLTGPLIYSGASQVTQRRLNAADLGNADANFSASADIWLPTGTLSTNRVYTLVITGPVPVGGTRVSVVLTGQAGGGNSLAINRAAGTMITFTRAAEFASAQFFFNGSVWRLESFTGATGTVGAFA